LLGGATLVALIGFGQWALEAPRVLGLYTSLHHAQLSGYFSTFINNNTLAGLLLLGALLGLGVFVESEHALAQRLAFISAGLCGVGVFASGSRGGQAALLIGLLIWAALAHSKGRRPADSQRDRARIVAKLALLSALIGLILSLVLLPDWHTLLDDTRPDQKLVSWEAAWAYARRYWLVGSGRGTFEYVYPQFQSSLFSGTVTHPENILLQLWCEWGLLGAIVGIGAGIWGVYALIRCAGRATAPVHWAQIAGLTAVGLQQLVDFGLESAGLAYPVAVTLGLAFSRCQPRWRPWAWVVVAPALLLLIALGLAGPKALAADPDEMLKRAAVEDVVAAHPADYLTPLRVGGAEGRMPLATRLGWLNRSMALFPLGAAAHLQAARLLAAHALPLQAALEYRLAMERAPWRESALLEEVEARLKIREALAIATPPTPRARWRLGNILLDARRAADARDLTRGFMDTHALHGEPTPPELHRVLIRACYALKDYACVDESARWLIAHGAPAVGYAFEALSALRRGALEEAREAIASGAVEGRADPDYQRVTAEVSEALGDLTKARAALDRLWQLQSHWPRRAAQALGLRAALELRHHKPNAALKIYREALALDPHPRYARAIIELLRAAGREGEAAMEQGRMEARARRVGRGLKRDNEE
ncbi:O-antigen ligase family protein, partial [Myxococcota bacterium]|nr:O-antigen ligase family protein [Myxococcota bacterium]